MKSNNIRLIIFDLGNVVFEINNENAFRYWAEVTSFTEEFFVDHSVPEMIFHQFERGEITPVEFHRILIKYKKVGLSTVMGANATEVLDGIIPLGRHAQAVEVARMVLFLASDQSSFSTGSIFFADGGLNA